MNEGLAQQATEVGTSNAGQQMPTMEELVMLLMQGVTPEDLVAAGVPAKMVEEALRMMQRQAQVKPQGMGNTAIGPEGLAASAMV